MRRVSFCFDDGFAATAGKVRTLFEARGLAACFAVLAAPELADDPFIRASPAADWGAWREAAAAGHAVEPHGFAHERLDRLPFAAAVEGLERTLDRFRRELPGFEESRSIFHLAYLAAPDEVAEWLGARMAGVRIGGARGLNPPGAARPGGRIACMTFGPDGVDAALAARIDRFLEAEQGWLVLVLHGLDGEGWGTVSAMALERQVDRLLERGVPVVPPCRVLLETAAL